MANEGFSSTAVRAADQLEAVEKLVQLVELGDEPAWGSHDAASGYSAPGPRETNALARNHADARDRRQGHSVELTLPDWCRLRRQLGANPLDAYDLDATFNSVVQRPGCRPGAVLSP